MSAAWIPAKAVTVSYNSNPLPATDVEYQHEIGEVDVTNLLSAGNYEFITDIKKRTLRGTIVTDANNVISLALGTQVSASYTAITGQTHSGTAAVTQWSEKGGPRGAMLIAFQLAFTGPVTNS